MKMFRLIAILLVAVLGIPFLTACFGAGEEQAMTYVSLRINPEIELIADEDGKVLSANAINYDGEVVLTQVDLEGMSVEDAATKFTETATDLGYMGQEQTEDTLHVGVQTGSERENQVLQDKIDKSVNAFFISNGINGKVSKETLDKYVDTAKDWNISNGHVKLVMRVLDLYPEFAVEDVLNMEVKEWLRLLKGEKDQDKIVASLLPEYKAQVVALKDEYARLFELRAQVKTLEIELEKDGVEDAEKEQIKQEITLLQAEIKPLESGFKNGLDQIKHTFKEQSKVIIKECEDYARDRIKEYSK